ncbi:hypothetical protein [Streptomyces fuscichromogenes]|uniref:hypothetical protein n=1 Tax=Streptomyces fuscichromogenes TaxID=1324013 RepID=UPI0016702B00|nr:hypothetical protein [Streptomyces fuscichromogenes]
MLRILDAKTGETVPAVPARRALTRVEAHASGYDLTALRVLLTTDLLLRALELGGTPVLPLLTADRHQAELHAAATTLGIRPFEDGRDLAAGLGEAQVVRVAAAGGTVGGAGVTVAVAPAGGPGAGVLNMLADPAALRLALLDAPRGAAVHLGAGALDEAARRLGGLRQSVARWARSPSRPVPEKVRGRLRDAWEDDLDVPAVLAVLRWMENQPEIPAGARFETCAYADRLLALDLTSDLGRAL